jgi:hypothetical protein
MANPLRISCSVVVVSVAVLGGLRQAQTVFAQTGVGRLTIQLTNATEEAIVDYERIVAPVVPAEGGAYSVPVICYSGPAVVLGVEDCGTNSLRVESSRDLTNWAAFPQPGFQLTLGTNSAAVIPLTGTNRFFRGTVE